MGPVQMGGRNARARAQGGDNGETGRFVARDDMAAGRNNYIARGHFKGNKGQQGRARASRHNITRIHIETNIDPKAAHEEGS